MAYNENLANRLRQIIGSEVGLSEKKMFGGLAFLINGNMAIAASGQGGLLIRVDPDQTNNLLTSSEAEMMEMRGRQMPGWLRVNSTNLSDNELTYWVNLSTTYVKTLPVKS